MKKFTSLQSLTRFTKKFTIRYLSSHKLSFLSCFISCMRFPDLLIKWLSLVLMEVRSTFSMNFSCMSSLRCRDSGGNGNCTLCIFPLKLTSTVPVCFPKNFQASSNFFFLSSLFCSVSKLFASCSFCDLSYPKCATFLLYFAASFKVALKASIPTWANCYSKSNPKNAFFFFFSDSISGNSLQIIY